MTLLTQQILLDSPCKVLDFGPQLGFPKICSAYTVEKLSLWQYHDEQDFTLIALRAAFLQKARAEGHLYNLSDEQLLALDNIRGNGVHCERKLLPAYVPIPNEKSDMTLVHAWVYISYKSQWVEWVQEESATKVYCDGVPIEIEPKVKPLYRVPDQNPYLHNRVCFLPPVYQFREGDISERMRRHVSKRNRQTMRNLFFRRMHHFLNADGDEPEVDEVAYLQRMRTANKKNGK